MEEKKMGYIAIIGAFIAFVTFVSFEIQGKTWSYNLFFLPSLIVFAILLAIIGVQKLFTQNL